MIRRHLLPLAGIALALLVLAGSIALTRHHTEAVAETPAIPVRIATVHLQPAEQADRYAAVITPRIEAEIGFRVGGKLVQRLVELGDRVDAGTPLARLDSSDLELQAASSVAQLASAEADAANAKRDFERYATLRQGQWTTQQEYDKRKAAMETAAARARQMAAEASVTRNNAEYAVLKADGPGVITAVLAEPGQVVAEGQTVFKIARPGGIEAAADVPEQAAATLAQSRLTIELWSLPGVTLTGHLRELAPSADANTRTYRAKVTLDDPPPAVRLGMTATLVQHRAETGSVAILPATSLAKTGDGPAVFVLSGEGDRLRLKPVAVAAYAGDRVVLAGGLAEGDRVVTAGVQKLDPAERVRIWTEPVR